MRLSLEQWILIGTYAVSIIGFLVLNRKRPLEAQAVFLFHQLLTWPFGILAVEFGYLEYPVREFPSATHTSFLYEFFAFPVVACYFNLFFPVHRGIRTKIWFYLSYTMCLTVPEIFLERDTDLIHYNCWAWYWSFLTIGFTLMGSRVFYRWFFSANIFGTWITVQSTGRVSAYDGSIANREEENE
ncbi:CBO0543 family protein [Gorillibacterium sp. sgz5001074]|uniref:CBO0543 family protein n=1 Tax=Gorillibacterium sp. sgz5001074 TaxID=3446695 RepID=UPI003F66B4B0